MSIETLINATENNSDTSKTLQMPSDHPDKQNLFSKIGEALENLSNKIWSLLWINDKENATDNSILKKFFISLKDIFWENNNIDIEKWVMITSDSDIDKVKEAFRPIIDLDETWVELKKWDFLIFNKALGTVDFYPADKNIKSGHAKDPEWIVPITKRTIPVPNARENDRKFEETFDGKLWKGETDTSRRLANYIAHRGPFKSGPNSCWTAVKALLSNFWIKTEWWNGNQWYERLKNDPKFQLVEVNSLSEIPAWGIMCYSGHGNINNKPHGSSMNQRYGHVEIKWDNGLYYSYYASIRPGWSAKAPSLHNNFSQWKAATWFQWVFVPVGNPAETHNTTPNGVTKKPSESVDSKEFIIRQLDILKKKGFKKWEEAILVSAKTQKTYLVDYDGNIKKTYSVSTSKNGLGNENESGKTSTGTLRISQKVGEWAEKLTVFKGLKPVGKTSLATKDTTNDLITSRVLVLEWIDAANKNARNRSVYFHGTNEEMLIGTPASHGCIRLTNDDVIDLFNKVKPGTLVQIA